MAAGELLIIPSPHPNKKGTLYVFKSNLNTVHVQKKKKSRQVVILKPKSKRYEFIKRRGNNKIETWIAARSADLHHGPDPDPAIDGVDADDGLGWPSKDATKEPEVVAQHYPKPQRDQQVIQLFFLHLNQTTSKSCHQPKMSIKREERRKRRETCTQKGEKVRGVSRGA